LLLTDILLANGLFGWISLVRRIYEVALFSLLTWLACGAG